MLCWMSSVRLSLSEQQRLGIARACLSDVPTLFAGMCFIFLDCPSFHLRDCRFCTIAQDMQFWTSAPALLRTQ